MATVRSVASERGVVRILTSERVDGDLHLERVEPGELERRRRALVDLPWTMLDERHGTEVVRVARPGDGDRRVGDVAVVSVPGAVVGVWAGDCAPVVLVAADGVVAGVHAGWRGLAAGVLDVAVAAVGVTDDRRVRAFLGPCIHPCCYEFGDDDLARVAAGVGAAVVDVTGRTRAGARALDVPAAVRAALRRHGIDTLDLAGGTGTPDPVGALGTVGCTGCDHRWFSHRARGDLGRHVVAAWLDAVPDHAGAA